MNFLNHSKRIFKD